MLGLTKSEGTKAKKGFLEGIMKFFGSLFSFGKLGLGTLVLAAWDTFWNDGKLRKALMNAVFGPSGFFNKEKRKEYKLPLLSYY